MASATSGFTIKRQSLELRFRSATLANREWLAPNYVRLRLKGPQLEGFQSPGADDHIRLFFADRPTTSVDELRNFPSREYTPLAWGEDWLDVEFVVHGESGVAGPWAASAPPGSFVGVGGPRGSAVVSGQPGSWMLAGDETAIPAIRRIAAMIPQGADARILIEVSSSEHEVTIDAPVDVQWVHRGEKPEGSALISLLDGLGKTDAVGSDTFCFIAAEQQIVRHGRALLKRWGVDPSQAVVKGYWKRDTAEYHAPH